MSYTLEQKSYTPTPTPTELVQTSHSASETGVGKSEGSGFNFGWVSNLIGSAPEIINQFNYKGKDQEIELARLQAEKANSENNYNVPGVGGINKTVVYAGVAVVVVVALVLIFKNK
ncbi:hypothetical protein [Brumimicrobium mesophilum]|uniref:hypothetical protein n=1 Tax=Brumimicrobium mesophilum TaxID=392717 RepID=UPI000D13F878|nr:hypothetical protein [Brumimicrobium mesophilum]